MTNSNLTDDLDQFKADLTALFAEMTALLVAKRQAYGAGNLTRFGGLGIVIRASDKIERLGNLYQSGEIAAADGESVEDAFRDLLGYGALGVLYHRQHAVARKTMDHLEEQVEQVFAAPAVWLGAPPTRRRLVTAKPEAIAARQRQRDAEPMEMAAEPKTEPGP